MEEAAGMADQHSNVCVRPRSATRHHGKRTRVLREVPRYFLELSRSVVGESTAFSPTQTYLTVRLRPVSHIPPLAVLSPFAND
jgi:hypothetical protein